ncbi:MAG: hypothetical protein HYZ46_00820 [Nitrosomonadales bacterium]|nr:hypothetical protein [Nitrosomonadales bacterium]
MDNKTVFIKTSKGEEEMRSKTPSLVGDLRRALLMVDGTATFAEISKRAAPSLRNILDEMFRELVKGGMIQDKVQPSSPVKMAVPTKVSSALKMPSKDSGGEELDFTSAFRAPSPEMLAAEASRIEAEKLKAAAEAKARADAEAKARQEHEAAQLKLQQEAVQRKTEQEAKARAEQEAKARAQAEAKAQQEAARLKAEQEAARVKAEAEARLRAEMERRAKAEAEAAKLKADQEAAKAKAEAEAKVREEAERRARAEAEAAKQKAEQEAAKARAELEAAKARAEAEAKAREEAERRAKAEAEAARVKAEQLAEEARRKAEQEAAKAREEAELRIKQEMEAARIKAEQEAAKARAELEAAKAKAEAEAKAREEAERRAKAEAEEARRKAEQEAAKAREEAERRVKQEVEAAKQKAEQEAAKARAELEAAKAKAEQEAQARAEKEQKARQEAEAARAEAARLKAEADAKQAAEAARLKAEQEAAEARKEAELAKQKILEESKAREEAEHRAKQQQAEANKAKSDAIASERSTSATVLFFDVVGYTKQSVRKQIEIKKQFNELVSECLRTRDGGDHIILDTGDGAAIGFMQHPEDALEVALQFRKVVMANEHNDYPDLKVRIGIHLGPIKLVKDMNGQSNMVGDGINDAQRVMSFAGIDEVYISRTYYDFVSRLSDEYATLFQYRGEQKDKHGREHQVYELIDGATPVAESIQPGSAVSGPAIKLEPFNFEVPEAASEPAPVAPQEVSQSRREEDALIRDMASVGKEGHAVTRAAEKSATAEQESAKRAESVKPAKPVAEVHMPTAEDVSTLAAAQAKAWAEAEQRAREEAQAKAERDAQPQKVKEAPPVSRVRRKPLPWGKLGAGVCLLAVIALFVVPMVLPMKDYANKIESMLSARLQQPVHIGQMSARLLPTPRLVLSEVTAGSGKQLQASQAQVNFAFSAVFSDTKAIDSIELQGVQANGAALQEISAWLQQTAADARYPVRHILLTQGKIETEGISFSGVAGTLDFNQSGKFIRGKLNSDAGKFAVDIDAGPDNKAQVSIAVRGTSLPLLPNWIFDELNAKGELSKDGLLISDFDARIAGGILLGDARLDWGSGWRAQGKLVAKTITMQNVHRLLEGDMEGSANFQMKSAHFSGLADNAVLDGRFVIKKGMIGGMDIVETARLRSRENMPGGRTHFDEFSGDLSYANGVYHYKQLKVTAGVLNATGAVDIAKQQVSGRVNAELTMRSGMGNVALQVGGTTETPTLRTAR